MINPVAEQRSIELKTIHEDLVLELQYTVEKAKVRANEK